MPAYPSTRKQLFSHVAERLLANQRALDERRPGQNQFKVFWIETDQQFSPRPTQADGWRSLERDLYVLLDDDSESHIWLDTSDSRIWYAYTFGTKKYTNQRLTSTLLYQRGVDRVWLAEGFMERVRKEAGYESRGFRIFFQDALVKDREDQPRFSAKFWVGRELAEPHRDFLDQAAHIFSRTSIRMGKRSELEHARTSGALMELYSEGNMTVTSSDSPEEILGLIRETGERYSDELHILEDHRKKSPRPVEFTFKKNVDLDTFQEMVHAGQGKTRLWMERYEMDNDLHRYSGVDLHTKQFITLDIAPEYAYLVTTRGGCMNAAPRFMTVSAKHLSGRTELFYEGEQVFA